MAQPPADYYRILGVAPDATEAELKIAYRNRARQCHPDQNPGDPAAEERFKELQVAYSVLSVPAERARYDRLLRASTPVAEPGGWRSEISALVDNVFGKRGDTFVVPFEHALHGGPVWIRTRDGDRIRVVLPPGMKNNYRVRVPDLLEGAALTFKVAEHPSFRRKKDHLIMPLRVSSLEALLGATKSVVEPYGEQIDIPVPPETAPGTRLRLKGRGVRGTQGDLLIDLKVVPIAPQERTALRQAAAEAGLMVGNNPTASPPATDTPAR